MAKKIQRTSKEHPDVAKARALVVAALARIGKKPPAKSDPCKAIVAELCKMGYSVAEIIAMTLTLRTRLGGAPAEDSVSSWCNVLFTSDTSTVGLPVHMRDERANESLVTFLRKEGADKQAIAHAKQATDEAQPLQDVWKDSAAGKAHAKKLAADKKRSKRAVKKQQRTSKKRTS